MGRASAFCLRLLPPEVAHDLGMKLLSLGGIRWLPPYRLGEAALSGMRLQIPGLGLLDHPIGLAAGFDKHLRAPGAFAQMGFSFLEAGTITPKPQSGNPKPRLFRYPHNQSIINRMGFNSDGVEVVLKRCRALDWQQKRVPLGINIGKNRDTPDHLALDDYLLGISKFYDHAAYLVANISSPNTEGLRNLASESFLNKLASELGSKASKVWIKLDPDQSKQAFRSLIEVVGNAGFGGVILSNTHRVSEPESGGQSGQPLGHLSVQCLEWAWEVHRGRIPMISSGGILSGADVLARIIRGASGVQLYTALVYRGPWAVNEILLELAQEMRLRGIQTLKEVQGSYYS